MNSLGSLVTLFYTFSWIINCSQGHNYMYINSQNKKSDTDPVFEYNGFEMCDYDGWSCKSNNGEKDIQFDCDVRSPNARIWLWTARLPEGTSILTVKNCQSVEVHTDCTRGIRGSHIKKFRVFNVMNLRFLKPTRPGLYLHDNYDSALLPGELHIENVPNIRFFPELFTNSSDECKNPLPPPMNLTFINTTFEHFLTNMMQNYVINKLILQQVFVKSVDTNALSLLGNDIVVVDSTFSNLYPKGFTFDAKERVLVRNNTFLKIQSGGLVIRAKIFQFNENHVGEIMTHGLDVLAQKITFNKNYFGHMDTRALENIGFAYFPSVLETATKFMYNFTWNSLRDLEPASFHPNWTAFKDTCSIVTVENNDFDCSCMNFGWMIMSHAMGPKFIKIWDFYDEYIINGKHTCFHNRTCTFSVIMAHLTDLCSNKTDIREICRKSSLNETQVTLPKEYIRKPDVPQLTTLQNARMTSTENPSPKPGNISWAGPVTDYENTTNRASAASLYNEYPGNSKKPGQNTWFIVTSLVVVFAISSLAVFLWWYKKSNGHHNVTTAYKNHMENDDDNPIVINEHRNQLYDEKN